MPARSMLLFVFVSLAFAVTATTATTSATTSAHANPHGSDASSSHDAERGEAQPVLTRSRLVGEVHSDGARSLVVTATAFNSLATQTDSDPTTAAWGDSLAPGMRIIAVSRDLIPLGLDHRAPVSIEGLPGKYRVLDKMNGRWSKRIDIYMGNDVNAALAWGRRTVRIHW